MPVTTEIVAGSSTDFMAVQHVTASGSQIEIGRALASQARLAYGWTPAPADRVKARARRARRPAALPRGRPLRGRLRLGARPRR
jgi:hypothetical protein